ncbi:MAG: gluconate 2-dehydrogenase subunit 3 family protein [Gemmatimonadetes bacterium]|nr:gluconate 2-dehydrogenase subunit 3 family protein [Gemmatimonadota bacterium]
MPATRRDFLVTLAVAGAGALSPYAGVREARAHADAVLAGDLPERFAVFTPAEAAEVQAIAARIVPTTDTPGATEAGVVHFFDKAFETFAARDLGDFREGLADIRTRAAAKRAGAAGFAALTAAEQDALLAEIEQGEFFAWVRSFTMMGMFADPSYGGNRDGIGWRLIGFENAMTHAAPFGYYDAQAAQERR